MSRSARVAAKCSRIACAGEPVTTRSLTWRSMIWPRSLTSVATLSMIAVAAKPARVDLGVLEVARLVLAVARAPGLRTAMSAWPLLGTAEIGGAASSDSLGRVGRVPLVTPMRGPGRRTAGPRRPIKGGARRRCRRSRPPAPPRRCGTRRRCRRSRRFSQRLGADSAPPLPASSTDDVAGDEGSASRRAAAGDAERGLRARPST